MPKWIDFGKVRIAIFLAMLIAGYFVLPNAFSQDAIVLTAIAVYFLSAYVHYFVRRYYFGKIVAFDMGGVLLKGSYFTQKVTEAPGVRDIIKRLRERYVVVVLSNNNELARLGVNRVFGYDALFDEVIYSSQTGTQKPDVGIYKFLCKKYGVSPSKVIMVDDDSKNIEGAKKAGLHGVHFNNAKQTSEDLEKMLKALGLKF